MLILIALEHMYRIRNPKVRRLIEKIVIAIDNNNGKKGECWSLCLRRIYKHYYGVNIGIGSYGCFDISRFPQGTNIGNYCSIAAGVRYFNANHPMNVFTTHPMLFNKQIYADHLGGTKELERNTLSIGNDVWIGYGTLITPSVSHIGNGVVIGAGSVVTHDIPDNAICAGNPCKIIRFRDSHSEEWYDWDVEKIMEEYREGRL